VARVEAKIAAVNDAIVTVLHIYAPVVLRDVRNRAERNVRRLTSLDHFFDKWHVGTDPSA
jgi:hypothetical protein